ncbi:MAG: formate/nitrite transporter family protein [Sedimentisphaerales bacterium]|nr:formate/nitrite transporter family protein [Sedimentisphaerales bacterium]MBN2843371.1 formate/nitrite transporter family protein [Sedimentisphaerales bacterium]
MVVETVDLFAEAAVKKLAILKNNFWGYFILSALAGIYVGFGIILIFSIGGPFKAVDAPGLKAIMGVSFGVALTLVIFAGSELFTGNNMVMTIGSLSKRVSWGNTLWLWFICYLGNLAGALLLSVAIKGSGLFDRGAGHDLIKAISLAKGTDAFGPLFIKGILCNMLVCLAVWMSARAKDDTAKIFLIFWCLFAFIGSGYEHSIANMTIMGVGVLVAPHTVTWGHFWWNMFAVSLGNIVGGAVFIGAAYWIVANKKRG